MYRCGQPSEEAETHLATNPAMKVAFFACPISKAQMSEPSGWLPAPSPTERNQSSIPTADRLVLHRYSMRGPLFLPPIPTSFKSPCKYSSQTCASIPTVVVTRSLAGATDSTDTSPAPPDGPVDIGQNYTRMTVFITTQTPGICYSSLHACQA